MKYQCFPLIPWSVVFCIAELTNPESGVLVKYHQLHCCSTPPPNQSWHQQANIIGWLYTGFYWGCHADGSLEAFSMHTSLLFSWFIKFSKTFLQKATLRNNLTPFHVSLKLWDCMWLWGFVCVSQSASMCVYCCPPSAQVSLNSSLVLSVWFNFVPALMTH